MGSSGRAIINSEPLRSTESGQMIEGGSLLRAPLEVTLNTSTFAAVTLGANLPCKYAILKMRDSSEFYISDILAGTTYFTISGSLELPIAKDGGATLCFAKCSGSETTLEVLLVD